MFHFLTHHSRMFYCGSLGNIRNTDLAHMQTQGWSRFSLALSSCTSSHAVRVIQNGGKMGLKVGITAWLGDKFRQLRHTSSNGGRFVKRRKPCRSVYLMRFPSACKLFHINIPLFIFLSVRATTWNMLQKKREIPCLLSIGCAPEGDVSASMSVRTGSKLLSNFAESLNKQNNKEDEQRAKNMYLESLAPGTVWNFEEGSYALVWLWTVRKKRGKDAQNLVLNNPRNRFNSVPFTANVHKHSIPLLKLTFSLSPWPKVEKFRKLS